MATINRLHELERLPINEFSSGETTHIAVAAACPQLDTACVRTFMSQHRGAVSSGSIKPDSCVSWAWTKNGTYDDAESGMKAAVFGRESPVVFYGRIVQVDAAGLALHFYGENAITVMRPDTTYFGKKRMRVDGMVYGYGRQTGTRTVRMTDGSAATVPVISIDCVGSAY